MSVVSLADWSALRAQLERYHRESTLDRIEVGCAVSALLGARSPADFEGARWWLLTFVVEDLRRETAGARHALLRTREDAPSPKEHRAHAARARSLSDLFQRLLRQGAPHPAAPSSSPTPTPF